MKKNKFITSTIILTIGNIVTKIINMLIRISISRNIGTKGMGVYMLVVPTFSFFISIAQMGLPVAISKLVSEKKNDNKKLMINATTTIMAFNVILLFIIFLLAEFIANKLLHDARTYKAIASIALVLPFISISSILRGYFFGKQNVIPHVTSNIAEDIIRMIVILIGLPISYKYGLDYAISFIILSNIISETTSIIILLCFSPKNLKLKKEDLKPDLKITKNVFRIGIPTTGSRLIASLSACLEPIILTSILLTNGYTKDFVVTEYGIINGYVLPILILPSFFTASLSSALIPVISEAYVSRKSSYVKSKLKQAIFLSFAIGLISTIIIILFSKQVLNIMYKTTSGVGYIKIMAPIFLLYYIEMPLSAFLQATGYPKKAMYDNLIGVIIKILIIFILGYFKIALLNLVIAILADIIIVTILHFFNTKKIINNIYSPNNIYSQI